MSRILVLGLGSSGGAVVAWATARGADVVAVDDRLDPAEGSPPVVAARRAGAQVLPPPGPEDWDRLVRGVDLVVPSPGVRAAHPVFPAARRAGVTVRGDVDLAVEAARDRGVPVVAVTGTNGKSTITTLVAALLRADGRRVAVGGNLGPPALALLEEMPELLVLEVSSFQLHATTPAFRPRVAVFANLAPDHLDWHGDFAAYAAAKARVCLHQEPDAVLVLPAGDAAVAEVTARSRARRVTFRPAGATAGGDWWVAAGVLGGPGGLWLPVGGPPTAPHDAANLAAAAAAAAAAGAGAEALARVAAAPPPRLHHRLETVGQAGGVRYVDDSKATNPHATLAALRSFDRVVLIVGGDRKGVDLRPVGAEAHRLRALVVIGADPADVEAALGPLPAALARARAGDMDEAVALAASFARPGDVVLCSPACASFDWYHSYAERGAAFRAAVDRLAAAPATGASRSERVR